jgi:hypothetical protein
MSVMLPLDARNITTKPSLITSSINAAIHSLYASILFYHFSALSLFLGRREARGGPPRMVHPFSIHLAFHCSATFPNYCRRW